MTLFEQFIITYSISATALAGATVLWRNWLSDHPSWKRWLEKYLGIASRAFTCGSCFTYWIALIYVIAFNPLGGPFLISYPLQWMSLAWSAVVLRFGYVFLQESVNKLVHGPDGHGH